ncbi:MAG: hypothetical protein E6Q60_04875 [Nitrosomonas oligotropha]|uniref:Uncharacterized protein n=1 Tax=Nitrosomonas oligotropha TaxID=42354 RepID=A0A5C7VUB4_9PROT|nr:MAG: hypothetical protein E6Q60_04875 [Nitrosomonas oligotropha]
MKLIIKTPYPGHVLELIGEHLRLDSGEYLNVFEFSELRLSRGEVTLIWRVDARNDLVDLPNEGRQQFSSAMCKGLTKLSEDEYLLDADSFGWPRWVQLLFHVNSPLTPEEQGVWVRVILEYDDVQGLHFAHNPHTPLSRTCAFWIYAEGWQQTISAPPTWVTNNLNKEWWLEHGDLGRCPSRGNRLLHAEPHSSEPLKANLLDIDPALKARKASDYRFSFALAARNGEWEVCILFAMDADFGTPPAVSGYATLLDFADRASAPLCASGARLVCAPRDGGWELDWLNVPGAQSPFLRRDAFTLETLSHALLSQHALGLAATRARNRLSFVPTWIQTSDPNDVVRLRFRLQADSNGRLADIELYRILTTKSQHRMILTLGGALGLVDEAWKLKVKASNRKINSPEDFLNWELQSDGSFETHTIAVGAVKLSVIGPINDIKDKDGKIINGLTLSRSPQGVHYRRAPLESDLTLHFEKATYTAFSMDPELGFETLSAVEKRPRPWALDLQDPKEYTLFLRERSRHDQSRLLLLQLKVEHENQNEWHSDVMLIDPSPFTAVRVRTTERLLKGEIFAEYVDDADQAPEWRFYSERGEMTAILPPQGIGEEMIKGYVHRDKPGGGRELLPRPNTLLDFRLTPNARLQLDRTDIDMARSEAPWSLRRLLGRRLGAVGVKLTRADFELLYGMQARLEARGLRIAELDGFIGRIPLSDELWDAYLRAEQILDAKQQLNVQQGHALRVAKWMSGLWNRPSWWRVYADLSKREHLVVDSVKYSLRPKRQTANPFSIGELASKEALPENEALHLTTKPHDVPRLPLRGGVDWPFQSPNIYEELLRKPDSSGGSIEGLVFGSLGGEGAQTAAFNNGKTLIITNTRQGRLDALTLIRVGRIAMTWNKARHVIMYERTTRRASRYVGSAPTDGKDNIEKQPPFEGVAALRKVREYIEITEPRRRYPDTPTELPISGPLVQSVFATTVIPVRSSWGRDIRYGFILALHGPMEAGDAPFFPEPQVFLDLARAPGKGEGTIAQRITSTEKLVFFTSTRDQDGGDTDLWPAWPDVDYPLLAPPAAPELPYGSSFRGRTRQPDASAIELGMGPFTFSLTPAEEAVNLMHGRPVSGLEAKVHNINLARGLPERSKVGKLGDAPTNFAQVHAQLLDGLNELCSELRERVAAGADIAIASQPEFQQDVKKLLEGLRMVATKDVGGTLAKSSDWLALQNERNRCFRVAVDAEAAKLKKQLEDQARLLIGTAEDAHARASALSESVAQQALSKIGEVSFVPRLALEALSSLGSELERRFTARLDDLRKDALRDLAQVEDLFRVNPERAAELNARWRERMAALPSELRHLTDLLSVAMDDTVGQWFSRLQRVDDKNVKHQTLFDELVPKFSPALAAAGEATERWIDSIPPFDLAPPDFWTLRSNIEKMLSAAIVQPLAREIEEYLAKRMGELGDWTSKLVAAQTSLNAWADDLSSALRNAPDVQQMTQELEAAAATLQTKLQAGAHDITEQLGSAVQYLPFKELQGSLDALGSLGTQVDNALKAVEAQLQGSVGEFEAVLREQAVITEQYVQAGARQMEEWARAELGPVIEIGKENVNSALETLRVYAEGPVTEAIQVSRERLGYYYHQAEEALQLTHASAMFNDLGQEVLNSLSTRIPFDRIRDRLLPMLNGFAVRDLFPDFCGIKLTYLLPDLDVPLDDDHQYDWLRVQHGFDKERLAAWAKVNIDKRFDEDAILFDLGSVKLRLLKPRFAALSDILIEKEGGRRQITAASLDADFELSLNDKPMVTLREGMLSFDERGELKFDFDSEKMMLAEELQFITDALRALMPQVEGLTITPLLPSGIDASLTLPLPDIGTGAFTLTGVTLNSRFGLLVGNGFEIRTGLWLSRPERPFGMAVLFLGGGGWFGIDVNYKPPSEFVTRVSVGLSAGAFVAVNFGFAYGSAGILFTFGVDFYRNWQTSVGSTAVSLGLLIWGEFSILGIASASIRLMLRITYIDGGMIGRGNLSVRIRLCWCYTLNVSRSVEKVFAKPSGTSSDNTSLATQKTARKPAIAGAARAFDVPASAARYQDLPEPDDCAVDDYFTTLAI